MNLVRTATANDLNVLLAKFNALESVNTQNSYFKGLMSVNKYQTKKTSRARRNSKNAGIMLRFFYIERKICIWVQRRDEVGRDI